MHVTSTKEPVRQICLTTTGGSWTTMDINNSVYTYTVNNGEYLQVVITGSNDIMGYENVHNTTRLLARNNRNIKKNVMILPKHANMSLL